MPRFLNSVSHFLLSDDGAVTVDWTVLAAAIVGLGIATVAAVRTGVVSLGGDIDTALTSASIASLGTLGSGVAASAWTLLNVSQAQYDSWLADFTNADEAWIQSQFDWHLSDFESMSDFEQAYNLDCMQLYIEAAAASGYDTAEMQARFDAAYATYVPA